MISLSTCFSLSKPRTIVAFTVTAVLAASSTDFSLSCTIFPWKLRLTVSQELLQGQEKSMLWKCKVFLSLSHTILSKTVRLFLHKEQRFPLLNLCSFLDKASKNVDGGNSANSALYLYCVVPLWVLELAVSGLGSPQPLLTEALQPCCQHHDT